MSKEGLQFPYYALREYSNIWDEGPYKLISTYYNTYVLDYVDKSGAPTLAERRLLLLSEKLPYKLYSLNGRYTHIAPMLMTTNRLFLDSLGNIKKIRKPKRYRLTSCKVIDIVELGFKRYGISFVLDNNVEYVVVPSPCNYIQVLILPTGWLYYDSLSKPLPDTIRGL